MKSYIRAIEYYFPNQKEYNDSNDRMVKKIGIYSKNVAGENEFASDLGFHAAEKLFLNSGVSRDKIDFLIYCTQSPDYYLPTTACILQERLQLPTTCGAYDINLGCSGYIYGLSIAKGLIETEQAKNVLFITADTYSKYVHPKDRNVQLLFGDAATATLISGSADHQQSGIGPFSFGTDGRGAEHLIVPAGGLKEPLSSASNEEVIDAVGNVRTRKNVFMNGSEVFNFAVNKVPKAIDELLTKMNYTLNDFNYFVFHQANKYMLETLRRKMEIPEEKFSIRFDDCGNTVSSTIPIALIRDFEDGIVKNGDLVLLAGFGVGFSWGVCAILLDFQYE